MAEGEDREQRSGESGDTGDSETTEYDPTSKPGEDEERSEESGDTGESEEAEYDPSSGPGSDEPEEESGPAFHPHDRARTEREWASDDEEAEDEEDDELPDADDEPQQKDTRDEEDEDEEEEPKGAPPPFRAFMLFVATIVFLIVGFLFFSALIAPTYIVALILAALWFVAAYFLLGRFTRNRRHLRFPIRIAFGVTVAAVLLWLVISTVGGTTVNERLVTGQKLSEGEPTARIPEKPQNQPPAQNILVATGKFESSGAGSASGQASFVKLPSGQTKLTLKGLDVTSGPTLHVFLATHDGKSVSDSKDLGSLKGNKGDQQYDVPQNVDPKRYKSVVIWCKVLGVPFGRAETRAQ